MHSRVAMMAVVGYLVGESTPTPFGIAGPANDQVSPCWINIVISIKVSQQLTLHLLQTQLQQVPLPLFAALSFFIFVSETFRANK